MGGHSTGETSLGASSIVWEVNEAGRIAAPMNSNQVLETIAAGRIGFASKIRRAPDGAWANTIEQGEFGYAFPYVNLPAGKLKRGQASPVGFIAVNPDVGRALDVARELALDPKARNLNFFCSAYLDWISAPIIRRSRLFQMWDGFWIAPIAESTKAKPGGWLNLYLFALNLKDKEQQRTLRASGSPVAEGMRGNLSFSIPSRSWAIQLVSIPAAAPSGFHKIAFRTRSGAERAATAVAVGVLTLGSFVYAPGSSGFDLQYEILTPEATRIVDSWEAFAIEAADKRLEAAHAKGISHPRDQVIAKDSVLQRFRAYLTPALVVGILEDKRQPPRESFIRLFDEFLFDWLGFRGAETAFRAD